MLVHEIKYKAIWMLLSDTYTCRKEYEKNPTLQVTNSIMPRKHTYKDRGIVPEGNLKTSAS